MSDKMIVSLNVHELTDLIEKALDKKLTQLITVSTEVISEASALLSRQDVAEIFGVSLVTLNKWTKCKILPKPIKQGGRLYYLKNEIQQFILTKNTKTDYGKL